MNTKTLQICLRYLRILNRMQTYYSCNSCRKVCWYPQHEANSLCEGQCMNYCCKARAFYQIIILSSRLPTGRPPDGFLFSFHVLSHLILSVYSTPRGCQQSPELQFCPSLTVLKPPSGFFPLSENQHTHTPPPTSL